MMTRFAAFNWQDSGQYIVNTEASCRFTVEVIDDSDILKMQQATLSENFIEHHFDLTTATKGRTKFTIVDR